VTLIEIVSVKIIKICGKSPMARLTKSVILMRPMARPTKIKDFDRLV
jgi:hypothetical protein